MLDGDLKGLQRMTQWRHEGKAAATPESFKEKLARLSDSERKAVRKVVENNSWIKHEAPAPIVPEA